MNQERSTHKSNAIGVNGMNTLPDSARVKPIPSYESSIEDIEEEEDDGEVVVHQQDNDSDVSVEQYEFNECIRTVEVTGYLLV